MKKLLGRSAKPPGGTTKLVLQRGQASWSPGRSFSWCSPYWSRHLRQNVCTHGNTLGSVNVSLHIEHSVTSLICSDQRFAAAAILLRLSYANSRTIVI